MIISSNMIYFSDISWRKVLSEFGQYVFVWTEGRLDGIILVRCHIHAHVPSDMKREKEWSFPLATFPPWIHWPLSVFLFMNTIMNVSSFPSVFLKEIHSWKIFLFLSFNKSECCWPLSVKREKVEQRKLSADCASSLTLCIKKNKLQKLGDAL